MSQQFVLHADSSGSQSKHNDIVWNTRWSGDGTVLSAGNEGTLKLWDGPTSVLKETLDLSPLAVVSLSTTPHPECQSLALTSSMDGTVALISIPDSKLISKTNQSNVWRTAIHPISLGHYVSSHSKLSSSLNVHSASFFEPQTEHDPSFGQLLGSYEMGRSAFIMSMEFSPDGKWLVAGAQSGQCYVFDAEAGSLIRVFTAHSKPIRSISFSPDSSILYTSSDDTLVSALDIRAYSQSASGSVFSFSNVHSSSVTAVSAAPDSKLLASGSTDKTIRIFDIGQRAPVSVIADDAEVWSLNWRPLGVSGGSGMPGQGFVSGNDSGVVKWWKNAT